MSIPRSNSVTLYPRTTPAALKQKPRVAFLSVLNTYFDKKFVRRRAQTPEYLGHDTVFTMLTIDLSVVPRKRERMNVSTVSGNQVSYEIGIGLLRNRRMSLCTFATSQRISANGRSSRRGDKRRQALNMDANFTDGGPLLTRCALSEASASHRPGHRNGREASNRILPPHRKSQSSRACSPRCPGPSHTGRVLPRWGGIVEGLAGFQRPLKDGVRLSVALGTYRLRKALLRRIGPHSGWLARALHHPDPFRVPWRRPLLDVVAHGGIGDVIMCTPALRELKRRNPRCRVRFYTRFSSLVSGLPYIDEALPYEAAPSGAIYLDYSDETDFIAPRAPLVSLLGDKLGLRIQDAKMDCVVDDGRVTQYRAAWRDLPRPHVAVVRRASSSRTSNKNWPDGSWRDLIARLCQRATVIELGEAAEPGDQPTSSAYVDLRGRTSVEGLAAAIAAADLYVGPMSGPAHIAAAVATPGVIIYGGYEPPTYTAYPGRVGLATKPSCSPCWLATACPYDRMCLSAISSELVEQAIWHLWTKSAAHAG